VGQEIIDEPTTRLPPTRLIQTVFHWIPYLFCPPSRGFHMATATCGLGLQVFIGINRLHDCTREVTNE